MDPRKFKTLPTFVAACIIALVASVTSVRTLGDEPEKPAGFSGYLLDTRGLEEKNEDAIWREDFESSGVSWRYLYQEGSVNVDEHRRVYDFARDGQRSEYLSYEVEEPGVVVFAHYVDYPAIYPGVSPSLWVRSDRPGVSLAALVVFPKTLRPDNGKPFVALVPGATYQRPGEWQKLDFPQGLEKTFERTVQSIRGEHKAPVSVDCAYIRQILLISEARAGHYSLWVDDLEIEEHLSPSVESLREWERDSAFEPINLLSCRLKLSSAPIFGHDDFIDSDVYGIEPFGIDQEKVAEKNKRKLAFVDGRVSRGLANSDQSKSFANADAQTSATFDAANFFLQSRWDGRIPIGNETIARNATNAREPGVGQANFLKGSGVMTHIANASFDASLQAPNDGAMIAQNQNPEPAPLVAGSGTLSDPEDAATESFRRHNDRLVADAQFRNGLLETTGDQRIYSIRAIEYQGESFAFLKQLGFNAVWIAGAPTAQQLADAEEIGIWLIAAPPTASNLVSEADVAQATARMKQKQEADNAFTQNVETSRLYANAASQDGDALFGGVQVTAAYAPVLLWYVGAGLDSNSLQTAQSDFQAIRLLDPLKRPIIGSVNNGVEAYTQEGALDAVMLTREPLTTSLDLNDYAEWLVKYQNLATNPRAVFWNKIQTQPTISATLQRQFLGMADETPGIVSYEQMRQLVRASMRARCRGLLFSSLSRLDAKDHKTQYRAAALEAINLELQLIGPWFALGDPEQEFATTSTPSIKGIVSRTKRSFLFVPFSAEPNNQYVMGQDAVNNLSATIPAREGYSPDLLAPGALRKIVSKRRAGGCWFTLDEGNMNSVLFFTQSDSLSQKISERAPAFGTRLAKLSLSLARKRLDLYEQTVYVLRYVEEHGRFPRSAPNAPALGAVVERVADQIDEAEVFLRRRDASQAYLAAERATREIRKIEREFWTAATRNEIARPVTPLSTSFYDMPAYLELYDKLLSGALRPTSGNLIVGGDMEDQRTFVNGGWRVFVDANPTLNASAAIEDYQPDSDAIAVKKSAGKILKLQCAPQTGMENRIPQQVETAILNVETEFNVSMGQLICFQGWIKIPRDLTNSVDGIEIFDDQGGRGLALRFKKQMGWTQFAFYRLATNNGPMRIRFALSGVGEVWLDDVAAYALGPSPSPVAATTTAPSDN